MTDRPQNSHAEGLGVFGKYLSLWVALCIVAGVAIGRFFPGAPALLSRFEYAHVSIPVAILIWVMIYPMMLKVDFSSVVGAFKAPKGLTITTVTNWLIKPFTMFFFAWLFLLVAFRGIIPEDLAREYLAGAVLLGAAPCTAMVFVWSHLTKGNAGYTLVQVAVNDLILIVAFAPIVMVLLGISDVAVPYDTLLLSVVIFILVPLTGAVITRRSIIHRQGESFFANRFLPKFRGVTTVGLLATLILLFSFQGETILSNPFHIVLIAVPLVIQTFFIFALAYGWAKLWKVPHDIASPAAMIGASNFFELAVAVAVSLFGLSSGAALATVVGVLVEVPVMLALVKIANATKGRFNPPVPVDS